jgi:Flp pilus assembly protein TadD
VSVSASGRVTVDGLEAAVAAQQLDRATAMAEQAYGEGLRDPLVLNLLAYKLELEDRLDEALQVLGEAQRANPNDPFILNSIGVCHSKADRQRDALAAFEAALAISPNYANAHHGIGLALGSLGEFEIAKQAHWAAARLEPRFPDPLGAIAAIAAEQRDWAEVRRVAGLALALEANQPAATLALARADIGEGLYEAAEQRLADLVASGGLARMHLSVALNLRADALDALGRHEEAMQGWLAGNRELRRVQVPAYGATELGLDTAERMIGYFERAPADAWRAPPETGRPGGEVEHVFLTGFARSGTTLLEQILASHGGIVALEEKRTIDDTIVEFFQSNEGLDRFAALDEEGLRPWRELYWQRVREFGVEPSGKVYVDKLPMHTIYLPAIARLFPRAKIILARRDPRDVVVSCFRNRFRPNRLVVEFTDLERTAKLYSGAMRLAEIYAEKLTLPTYIHRHEDLVADLDGATRRLCEFIGVDWDANMMNFVETANRRDIRTPSASQVRQGLNASGVGIWRRYGATIDPIQPILAPWVEAFGYPKA